MSTAPLDDIICNREATGQVTKSSIELAAHMINNEPLTAIKSQALADFLVTWTESLELTKPPGRFT
jgi:hypothetical protein